MSWINNSLLLLNYQRGNDYNRSVGISVLNIAQMLNDFDGIFNNFVNFTDEISSLRMYPFEIRCDKLGRLSTTRGETQDVDVGEINDKAKFITLGEYYVERYYNNFADFNGYTQIKVFLPMLGYVDVDVNECMGRYLQFRLAIDYYTGKGMYIIGVSDNTIIHTQHPYVVSGDDEDMRVISTFECDLGVDIPLGQSNMGDIKRNLLLGAVKTAAAIGFAAHTATLPPATTSTSSVKTYDIQGRSKSKGSRLKTIKSGTETTTKTTVHHVPVDKSKPFAEAIDSSIDALNRIHISGNTDRVNDAGLMWSLSTNIKVVIYRPKFVTLNDRFASLYGYPLGEVRLLSFVEGYTEINSIHFEDVGYASATQAEIAMLEEMFANGVIFPIYPKPKPTFNFTIDGTTFTAEEEMTWGDWIDSKYNTVEARWADFTDAVGVQIKVDGVYKFIFYDENYVQPEDNVVVDGDYTTTDPTIFTFTIDGTIFTAKDGMTWGVWADSVYNTVEARFADFAEGTGMQIKVDGVYKYIYYNEQFVQNTDIVVVDGAYTTSEPTIDESVVGTWIMNDTLTRPFNVQNGSYKNGELLFKISIPNPYGLTRYSIKEVASGDGKTVNLSYTIDASFQSAQVVYGFPNGWTNNGWKKITILEDPADTTLKAWIRANGVKQADTLNLIAFKIGTTNYIAEEGMTWYEWCHSEYNTYGYSTLNESGSYVTKNIGAQSEYVCKSASGGFSNCVVGTDIINDNATYYHYVQGGGAGD